MKAILQGEFHTSKTDKESLFSRFENGTDAIFIEKRQDKTSPKNWTFSYVIFLIGILILYWGQETLSRESNDLTDVNPPVYDDIDTNLPELYQRFPISWKITAGFFTGAIFLIGVFETQNTIIEVFLPQLVASMATVLLKLTAVLGSPLLYSSILVIWEERQVGSRDRDMADRITKISKQEGYDSVVVSCGDAHVEGLSDELEERGWETEVYKSNHSILPKLPGIFY